MKGTGTLCVIMRPFSVGGPLRHVARGRLVTTFIARALDPEENRLAAFDLRQ
jgi:hypothetical protein